MMMISSLIHNSSNPHLNCALPMTRTPGVDWIGLLVCSAFCP